MAVIQDNWDNIYKQLHNIKNFNPDSFIKNTQYLVDQIYFFNNRVAMNQTGDPSTSYFKPKSIPNIGQIAYFNLTDGFPKELKGGHWCYVVQRMKGKFLIIPCTSIKNELKEADTDYQLDIELENFPNSRGTRLQLSDMRSIDAQRLYSNKGFYNVVTPIEAINTKLIKLIA